MLHIFKTELHGHNVEETEEKGEQTNEEIVLYVRFTKDITAEL